MNDRPDPVDTSLADSYATNVLSLKLSNQHFILAPSSQGHTDVDRIPAAARSRMPMHIVSAWSPQGESTTFERNQLHAARLEDAVAKRTHHWLRITLIGAGSGWYEQAVAVSGYTDKQALTLGKRFKQAAVIRIDREGWHVLPTGLRDDIASVTLGWRLEQRIGRTCAMRTLDPNAEPCRMIGGPFGSRAMAAAADWAQRRRVAFALLGCDNCETRATELAEQGLILNPDMEWCVASRHGGAIVRDKARRKYAIPAGVIGEDEVQ